MGARLPGQALAGRPDRRRPPPRPPRRDDRRLAQGAGAAWAFIAPVAAYLAAFYAYPLYRNIDLSLKNYTVASFVTAAHRSPGSPTTQRYSATRRSSPALINTAVFVFVSIAFQFAIGLALAVFFYRKFRLSGILRALFLSLAAAAAGVRVDLVVDAEQRLGDRELLPAGLRHRAGRLADLAATGRWPRC